MLLFLSNFKSRLRKEVRVMRSVIWLFLSFLFLFNPAEVEGSTVAYTIANDVLIAIDGLNAGDNLVFPESVKAVDLELDGLVLGSVRSKSELDYCNLLLRDCDINELFVDSKSSTLTIQGGIIADITCVNDDSFATACVSCSGISVIQKINMNADDSSIDIDATIVQSIVFGNNVEYAEIDGNSTSINSLTFGNEVSDFLAADIYQIDSIENESDYIYVIDGKVYCYLEYGDDDCAGSSVRPPDLALCFYPKKESEKYSELNISETCDTIASYVFSNHQFSENTVIIPEGIRIIQSYAFAQLQSTTEIVFPKSLEFLDQVIAAGSTVKLSFNQETNTVCNPQVFGDIIATEIVIPRNLTFYYYNASEEELRLLINLSSSGVGRFICEKDAIAASILNYQTASDDNDGESTVKDSTKVKKVSIKEGKKKKLIWEKVENADVYVVKYSKCSDFAFSIKQKVDKNKLILDVNGGIYYFKVRAVVDGVKHKWSKTIKYKF